ncbi:urease isoform X1 [Tanacetum coccineum]
MGNGTSSHYLRLIRSSNDLFDTDVGRVVTFLGDAKSVILVRIDGNEIADNFVNDANVKTMMESVNARGFGNSTDTNGSPLAYRITREAYANIYGPTVVADNIRLGDTDLFAEVEKDFVVYGKKL